MPRFVLFIIALFLATGDVSAQFAVSIRAGTLGAGIGVAFPVSEKFDIRVGGSYLPVTISNSDFENLFGDFSWGTSGGGDLRVDLTGEVTMGAAQVLIDWHPFGRWWRLTSGVYFNLIDIKGSGEPTDSFTLNDKEFAPEKLGTLDVGFSYPNPINPYIGIGFGDQLGNSRVTLLLDIGALYMGPPEFNLEATGMLAPTASEEQQAGLNKGFESFRWLPSVSLGFAVRF